jgi:hypothetical protein
LLSLPFVFCLCLALAFAVATLSLPCLAFWLSSFRAAGGSAFHLPSRISTRKVKFSGMFLAPKNDHQPTTFHQAIHHNFTTKNHRQTPAFSKHPQKAR